MTWVFCSKTTFFGFSEIYSLILRVTRWKESQPYCALLFGVEEIMLVVCEENW